MINLNRIDLYKKKLENKTKIEQEKLLYELIRTKVISLGEFRSLLSTINIRIKNEY